MKTCNCCKQLKEFELFSKCKTGKYGLLGHCIACKQQKKKAWLEKNPDYNRNYYAANQEILLQKKREKRKDPIEKEKTRVCTANRRARMGEEAWLAWRKKTKNKDKVKEYNKEYSARLSDAYILRNMNKDSEVRLSLNDIPKELIEARRLLTLIRRASVQKEDTK